MANGVDQSIMVYIAWIDGVSGMLGGLKIRRSLFDSRSIHVKRYLVCLFVCLSFKLPTYSGKDKTKNIQLESWQNGNGTDLKSDVT